MAHDVIKVALTDTTSERFVNEYQRFIRKGDFIALTRQFEYGFKQTGKHNLLNFEVSHATVYLIDNGVLLVEPHHVNHNETTDSEKLASNVLFRKNVVISSGIHGNETAPIEIVQQLVFDVITKKVQIKHRTLFIIGNPVAMNIGKRFQIENLNRLFCNKHQAIAPCFEKYRAEKLEAYVSEFFTADRLNANKTSNTIPHTNYHYDLHTAIRDSKFEKFALYPFQENKPWDKAQLSFLAACGVNTILFGHAPSGTFSYFSSANFSAHAFTVELGKVRAFGENNMADFQAILKELGLLIYGESTHSKAFNNQDFNLFKVLGEITKTSEHFSLNIDDNASNFTDYPIGTILSTDGDNQYRTTQPGESIVFPNANVACGQRAALIVIPTTLT